MNAEQKKLMLVSRVSEILSCSESFVYARIADGSLKHFRLGAGQGGIRVSEEQLQEYLQSRERGGKPEPAAPPLAHITLGE